MIDKSCADCIHFDMDNPVSECQPCISKSKWTSKDEINHPAHYTQGGIECIDAIEASMTPDQFEGYLKGNVQKYLWRYEIKGGLKDLEKAMWYLDRLIKHRREHGQTN